jgi:hypothetical protein
MIKRSSSKILRAFLAAAAVAVVAPAATATSGTNTISDITIEGTQFARLALNGGAIGGRPACHNAAFTVHYQWDITTAKGKAMLTTAQAAQLAGKRVSATGGATCTAGAFTIETLQTLTIWTI